MAPVSVGASRKKTLLGIRLFAGIGDSYDDLTMLDATDLSYTFRCSSRQVRNVADVLADTEVEAMGDLWPR